MQGKKMEVSVNKWQGRMKNPSKQRGRLGVTIIEKLRVGALFIHIHCVSRSHNPTWITSSWVSLGKCPKFG
jgi:hypothetical protein